MEFKKSRCVVLLTMFLNYIEFCKALNHDPLYKNFKQFKKAYKNVKLINHKYE